MEGGVSGRVSAIGFLVTFLSGNAPALRSISWTAYVDVPSNGIKAAFSSFLTFQLPTPLINPGKPPFQNKAAQAANFSIISGSKLWLI